LPELKPEIHSLSLLIVDDDVDVRNTISKFLEEDKFTIYQAKNPSDMFGILEKKPIDIIILDVQLPEISGIEALKIVKDNHPEIEVIMITGHGDMDTVIEAMHLNAFDFFRKPFDLFLLKNSINRTTKYVELKHKLKKVEKTYSLLSKNLESRIGSEIIGESNAIKAVVELSMKAAQSMNTTVLITGGSGTGKELIAHAIHHAGPRKHESFVVVNAAAIPGSLLESEFFGHVKGAFTGAIEDKMGYFEAANGGTLFLDEIGDMPLELQGKILRVLETKKVKRVGSSIELPFDVRFISATNQNLGEKVKKKEFRLDLYYRLNTVEIEIPSLKERPEDIPLLVEYFIVRFAKELKKPVRRISDNVMNLLKVYKFPGNVRELRNIIEQAIILCESDILTISEFPLLQKLSNELSSETSSADWQTFTPRFDLPEIEKQIIRAALEKSNYNKTLAAKLLNLSWTTLDRRIKKHNL